MFLMKIWGKTSNATETFELFEIAAAAGF